MCTQGTHVNKRVLCVCVSLPFPAELKRVEGNFSFLLSIHFDLRCPLTASKAFTSADLLFLWSSTRSKKRSPGENVTESKLRAGDEVLRQEIATPFDFFRKARHPRRCPRVPFYRRLDASFFYKTEKGRRWGSKKAVSLAEYLLAWSASGTGCVNFFFLAVIHRWAGFPRQAILYGTAIHSILSNKSHREQK